MKRIQYFILFFLVSGCIEPYEFVIQNNKPSLVVEAYISDKSFNETLTYPSEGRYFTVKLTSTSDVTNVRAGVVGSARVQLFNNQDDVWEYTESSPGIYSLHDDDFKAESGVMYKLRIAVTDESVFETDWESLPEASAPTMGNVSFNEETIQKYAIMANEKVLVSVKGIWVDVDIPVNMTGEQLFYRWSFTPHWIYMPPKSPSPPLGRKCWVTDPNYIRNYALQQDNVGGYKKNLFFMETIRNERIFHRFSSLIIQHSMKRDYYYFWKEMQEQNEGSQIIDKPPFNLATNFHSLNGGDPVSGYFGVVHEQAKRWYFDKSALSYFVENTLYKDCSVPFQDPAPECFDCREYSFGITTNVKPDWWED